MTILKIMVVQSISIRQRSQQPFHCMNQRLLGSQWWVRCSTNKKNSITVTGKGIRFLSSYHLTHIPSLQLFDSAVKYQDSVAIVMNHDHQQFTYGQLLKDSGRVAEELSEMASSNYLKGKRVCFLFDPSYAYVVYQWAVWRCGAVAVPLCNSHPTEELEYYIDDSEPDFVFYDEKFESVMAPLNDKEKGVVSRSVDTRRMLPERTKDPVQYSVVDSIGTEDNGMFVYTSGTTGRPKGVVTTHGQISSQISCLIDAWRWTRDDRIIHVLPLHHVHGIINCLCCGLWSGATVEFMKFEAHSVWERFAQAPRPTLFMAVPTIYVKMISAFQSYSEEEKKRHAQAAHSLRLMVSGSAALPDPVFNRWKDITGHTLLERYGMTEISMALSNPYDHRIAGYVGVPLPGVTARIVDEQGHDVSTGESGELLIKGPSVFKSYWNRAKATEEAFTDGWFKTGDTAVVDFESGYYKILGRNSVDIIKHGGYKISALDIERAILSEPIIDECAVVGIPDEVYGQKIAAVIVLKSTEQPPADIVTEMKHRMRAHLPHYKIPYEWVVVPHIPRNAMGKVNKKDPFFTKIFLQREKEGK